jgi:hypothetical protein
VRPSREPLRRRKLRYALSVTELEWFNNWSTDGRGKVSRERHDNRRESARQQRGRSAFHRNGQSRSNRPHGRKSAIGIPSSRRTRQRPRLRTDGIESSR